MPGGMGGRSDKLFFYALLPFAAVTVALFLLLFKVLVGNSLPIFLREGFGFIESSVWRPSETNPQAEYYGMLAPILGTFYSSIVALLLALPASISLTILIDEYAPHGLRGHLVNTVEIMAGLPTVLYGLWGAYILAPALKSHVMQPLNTYLGMIPLFSCTPTTPSTILTAGVVLAIMVTPFMTSIIREAYESVPLTYREAALSIGAARYEYVGIMMSMIKPAVLASILLGFGRAAGETIAVSMTIGNSFSISPCLFKPGYTISSLIADQFGNAGFYHYMTYALYGAGFLLLLIGLALNTLGLYLLVAWRKRLEAR